MVERFVGLDVSQRLTSVCILDERGKRVWRGKCATDPGVIEETVWFKECWLLVTLKGAEAALAKGIPRLQCYPNLNHAV